jgi:4-diphosphocytidyl-2-C-methyl-D-erythritol kinase
VAPARPGGGGLDRRLAGGLEVEVRAPAKINLSLRVLGRRPDGYHELSGLMARLELADVLRLRLLGGPDAPGGPAPEEPDRLTFGGPAVIAPDAGFNGPSNLVLRAAAAYRRASGRPDRPLAVHLVKNVALGAGLGGGSSDAAAVLRLLDASDLPGGPPLGPRALRELAASLGADVPFFLEAGPLRLASGIGERLAPFRGRLPGRRVVLANPGRTLSTAAVFGRLALTTGQSSSNSLTAAAAVGPGAIGQNDLWSPASGLVPELDLVLSLLAGTSPAPLAAGLSGSGPTCWALHRTAPAAGRARGSFLDSAARAGAGSGWWSLATAIG